MTIENWITCVQERAKWKDVVGKANKMEGCRWEGEQNGRMSLGRPTKWKDVGGKANKMEGCRWEGQQNGRISLGRPKPPTKGSSAPDEEEAEYVIVIDH